MNAARLAAKAVLATADTFAPTLPGPRILIYHQVGSGRTHEMNIDLPVFCRQLEWMRHHGEIVSLVEAVTRRGESDSHRLFVLTFDDGYADVFFNAFPVMAKLNLPFTLYLTSGPIELPDDFPLWPGKPLTWGHVREMFDSGLVTLGAHTHTHLDLRTVKEDAIIDELDRSNLLIAKRVGHQPQHFTYPKGWWSERAHGAVSSRYITATLGSGPPLTQDSDLHRLHRIPVQASDAGPLFALKMRAGGRLENRLRRRLNRYDGP